MKMTQWGRKRVASTLVALLLIVAPVANALVPLQTWNVTSSTANWKAVACDSSCLTQYAAVYGGYIFKSTDGGGSWVQLTDAGSRNWNSLATSSNGAFVTAVDFGGAIYRSIDSGSTWSSVASVANWRAVTMDQSGATQVAVANTNGYIYLSSDYGVTWTQQATPGQANWSSININYPGNVIAAGKRVGDILVATKSAGVWTWVNKTSSGLVASSSTDSFAMRLKGWTGIVISDVGNRIVAVNDSSAGGGSGNLFFSSDTGTSWTEVNTGNFQWQSVAGTPDLSTLIMGSSNACGANCRLHYRNGVTFGTWNVTFAGANSATAYQIAVARDGSRGISPIYGGQLQYAGTTISSGAISLSLNNSIFRTSATITATVSPTTGGRTTFYANGKKIPGCISKVTSGSSVTCSYKGSTRGAVRIYARYQPTDPNYTATNSLTSTILVSNRTSKR
jgi:hypothetical protein